MIEYLVNFARTGDPNHNGGVAATTNSADSVVEAQRRPPAWPRFDPTVGAGKDGVMQLGGFGGEAQGCGYVPNTREEQSAFEFMQREYFAKRLQQVIGDHQEEEEKEQEGGGGGDDAEVNL